MSNSEFPIPRDGYLTFDAFTIKQHIKNALTNSNKFTDQNYEGSYMSTIIDIIAYTFHVLMFYLNKTSTETVFTETQLYENINRIVKMLDYKPTGYITPVLSFTMQATDELTPGVYIIPRYSYLTGKGIPYTFNEDVYFSKATTSTETITDVGNNKLLLQGEWREYPTYTAIGNPNESVLMTPGSNVKIDHNNIDVYVKSADTGKWSKWDRTPSLYLEDAYATKYEIRYNEDRYYEVKFGNNINGFQLKENDLVAIYYLETRGTDGEVGVGAINTTKLQKFITTQLTQILTDISVGSNFSYIADSNLDYLLFSNNSISTYSADPESVEDIRKNAPSVFRSQYRLVTQSDYENFININFSQLIQDVKVLNNWDYVSIYLKHYYDLGITNPNNASRVLYNQLQFADACNFNNIYLFVVPKSIDNTNNLNYVSNAYKQLITNTMQSVKTLTSEIIVLDPVYISLSICGPRESGNFTIFQTDADNSVLQFTKKSTSKRDDNSILNDIINTFTDYFLRKNTKLGQNIDISQLTADLLSIDGVDKIYTVNKITNNRYEGLSLMMLDPMYPDTSRKLIFNNQALSPFMFPYLADNISQKIQLITGDIIFENIEY